MGASVPTYMHAGCLETKKNRDWLAWATPLGYVGRQKGHSCVQVVRY